MKTIVFSDVDGTLLTDDKRVRPATRAAVRTLAKRGIPFVIVSARSLAGIQTVMRDLGVSGPVIAYSGAILYDEAGNELENHGFSKDLARRIVDFVESRGFDLIWGIYSHEQWLVCDVDHPRVKREEKIIGVRAQRGGVDDVEANDVSKILLTCAESQTAAVDRAVRESFPECSVARSSPILVEIMAHNVDKADAVEAMCARLGFDLKDAIAFGDNYNDERMLLRVGRGYLMGNAPEELSARMRLHTDDNAHDGVANALARLGLID